MGWIKLHRKINECWIWEEKPFDKARAWIDLLLLANHSDKKLLFNGNAVTVKKGQYLTSIRKLSDRWGWSYDKVSRFIKVLVSEDMLQKESDSSRTLLTIVNYEVYQDVPNTDECAERTHASEQSEQYQVNHPNTYRTPTSDKQECKELIKNDKNDKNGEYNSEQPTEHFDLEKNAAVLFRQWGNKNGFANMKVEWLNRFMGVPERNWMQLANLILQAVKAYKEEYKRTHPDEKVDYQYLKTMDKFFQEDLDYWLAEIQRRKESEE